MSLTETRSDGAEEDFNVRQSGARIVIMGFEEKPGGRGASSMTPPALRREGSWFGSKKEGKTLLSFVRFVTRPYSKDPPKALAVYGAAGRYCTCRMHAAWYRASILL